MPKTRLISPGSIPNHKLLKNLQLQDNYLSNDGGDEGLRVDDSGRASSSSHFTVGGQLKVTSVNVTTTDHNKFLVLDGTDVKYVTGDTLVPDILTAGTNCTLSGATLNVDDAFVKNNANDEMTGTLTLNVTGTAKAISETLVLTNNVNASDMDGTGTAIKFNQWYYDASTPAIEEASRIVVATESDWTSTASTRDAYMAFETSANGSLQERMRIEGNSGFVGIGTTNPSSMFHVERPVDASQFQLAYDSTNKMNIQVHDDGKTTFRTFGDGSYDSDLTLDIDGDIELNADGGDIVFKDASATLATINGSGLTINNITQVGSDTDAFLMSDSGVVKYVTGANLRSYIGAGTGDGDITGVSITTDSGDGSKAEDTSGSADFSILGSSGVNVTNSGTTITAVAVPAEIDHDSLNNFVANEHIDHTSVTLTAGDGLTGGGDISSNRSFAVSVDDSTIEINSDSLRVKDDGITYAKIQNMTDARMLGNNAGSDGVITEMTQANVLSFLGVSAGANANVSGDSGNAAIYDNSGTPAFKSGITKAEVQSLLDYVTSDADDTMTGNLTITKSSGPQLTLGYDANEKFTIDVADNGVTTIATTDNDGSGTAANLTLDVDGDIELNADGGDISFKDASSTLGTFSTAYGGLNLPANTKISWAQQDDYIYADTTDIFITKADTDIVTFKDNQVLNDVPFKIKEAGSAVTHTTAYGQLWVKNTAPNELYFANDAGNDIQITSGTELVPHSGTILGITCLRSDGSNFVSHSIQDAFTVEDSTHQITFNTPPSENVEIVASAYFDTTTTTDVTLYAGLSDNATYNSIGQAHEYDQGGFIKSDDEADDHVKTMRWILTSSELASVGSSNTFYIGFKTSDDEDIKIMYGERNAFGLSLPPFIIKAIALPSTIYTG